ncbi:small, acid-soluble spore protein, alpha/beta type [Anaerotignum sp.]
MSLKKKELTEAEKRDLAMKYEIAEELGLLEKVEQLGWKGLTAKESGRIGGIMGRRKIEARKHGTVQEGNLRDE